MDQSVDAKWGWYVTVDIQEAVGDEFESPSTLMRVRRVNVVVEFAARVGNPSRLGRCLEDT
jgi:hypothetical protein